jgi:hypothetical protein
MGQGNSALCHHFHQISKAEFEPQIPADAEDDDLPVEMAAFEKIIYAQHCRSAFLVVAPLPANVPHYGNI